jgi:hypothetical protein
VLRPEAAILSKHLASILTTANAPYSVQLDDAALAHCLTDIDLAKQHPGHVSAFLGEVPPHCRLSSLSGTTSRFPI